MKILIVGDSHSRLFNITNEIRDTYPNSRGINIRVLTLSGATIKGFGKRESTLSTKNKVIEVNSEFNPDKICFALGQVDLELGLYYQKIVKNIEIDDDNYIEELIDSYVENISSFCSEMSINIKDVIVKGVNLSTLSESRKKTVNYVSKIITENISDQEEVKRLNVRLQELLPPNSVRNKIHNKFNYLLSQRSIDLGFNYFDINDDIKDSITGNIRKEFLPAANDHHIVDSLFIRELHIQKLIDVI